MAVQFRPSPEHASGRSATRPDWAVLALLLLALIAAAPLWTGPGLVNTRSGGDSPFLFIRLHQLVENLRAGVFPARWMPDAAYGLGYPFFNFYAALPYYFASIFNLVGFDLLASIKIVQSLGFVFAASAMYGWVRSASRSASVPSAARRGSSRDASCARPMAWMAAAVYTFAPFHLVNVYVRGDSLAEFYAFVFFPLILWAIDRVVECPGSRSVAMLGLAYGGLILTHNVSALIFSPFVLVYIVIRSWKLEFGVWKRLADYLRHAALHILHCSFGIVLGLLVSAWFWLPALGEAPLVQLDVQTTGYFNYNEHFRSTDLVQSSLGFDYSTEPPHTPFAMGLAQAVTTLGGVAALFATRRGSTGLCAFILIGLMISTAMITPLSKPLWDSLPLLPLAQFPWRFLSVQAVFTSLAAGVLATICPTAPYPVSRIPISQHAIRNTHLAGLAALLLAGSAMLPLKPDYLPIRADEITPERIQLYEAFTTNIGTTIRAEYLPRTTSPRPYTGQALIDPTAPPRAIPVRGEAMAEQTTKGSVSQSWTVTTASEATLAFPTLFFPGWRASIDGEPVEARAAVDLGAIEVDVPAGEHTLALWFDRTPLRAGAELVSLAAMLGVLAMLALRRRTADDQRSSIVVRLSSFVSVRRYDVALLALAAVFAAVASAANAVELRDDDLVVDFESKPWLHHGVFDFGAARLAQYETTRPLAAGSPFDVMLVWTDVENEAVATVQLVTPSLHTFGGPEPLATASAPIQIGVNHYTLDVPDALAKGMYYVKVEVSTASGKSTIAYLSPVFYGEPPTSSESSDWGRIGQEIELKSVAVKHDERDRLTVAFDWVALKPIAANYAVSLRLQDEGGHVWGSLDTQPGYGFLPTSAWLPGEIQHDAYTLALPRDIPRDGVCLLDVVWYRVASQQEIGRVRMPDIRINALYGETKVLPPSRSFDVPPMQQRVDATFGGLFRLLGYDMTQSGNQLTLTLHWQAITDIGADFKFFVHVLDPATERIAAQVDARPGGDAYSTLRWVKDEVVSERVELELGSGAYRVATGWYDPASADRLPAVDKNGNPLPGNRVFIGDELVIP